MAYCPFQNYVTSLDVFTEIVCPESIDCKLWDEENKYIWGRLEGTDIKLWDEDNKYIWGRLEGTDVKLWDEDNNYIWGRIE